jgi:hypothetical protein
MDGTPPTSKIKVALMLAVHILRPDLRKLRNFGIFHVKSRFDGLLHYRTQYVTEERIATYLNIDVDI